MGNSQALLTEERKILTSLIAGSIYANSRNTTGAKEYLTYITSCSIEFTPRLTYKRSTNHIAASICILLYFIFKPVCHVYAADETLQEDYHLLKAHNQQTKSKARQLEERLSVLEDKNLNLQTRWGNCAHGRWRVIWQATADAVDELRNNLEKQRNKLFALNNRLMVEASGLEAYRRNIEYKHRQKDFEYESAFRDYMDKYQTGYLFHMDNYYIHGIKLYISSIEKYQSVIEYSLKACNTNDFAPAALDYAKNLTDEFGDTVHAVRDLCASISTILAKPKPESD
jgi:hypothetical protein